MSVMPKLTKKQIQKVMKDIPKHLKEMELDDEDRRTLHGKYAPPEFMCLVCEGTVKAVIRFPENRMIGGPPTQAYIHHYECSFCRIMYGGVPEDT